jgi:hypothetical protein
MLAAGAAKTLRRDDSRAPGGPPGLTGVARVKDEADGTAQDADLHDPDRFGAAIRTENVTIMACRLPAWAA